MPHVVTRACCGDASCTFACPVNCIHPTPDEPDFATAEMLYIDPTSCVDCGACVSACPVGAIVPGTKIGAHDLPFVDINAAFHEAQPADRFRPKQAQVPPVVKLTRRPDRLRVAIVGSGPAGMYAADELLKQPGVEVTMIDRLPTPHGLVRAGVAPDHPDTKTIDRLFRQIEDQRGFHYALGLEVGTDVTHDELAAHHHAVVYATGASEDRSLGIPGESLPGSATATDVVAWYNGHPDAADETFDLSHERAVIIGNGNVALDVARVLATDPEQLERTDIADHALAALRTSAVREIVVVGRRGVAQAAFTLPELTGLLAHDDVQLLADQSTVHVEVTADPGLRRKQEMVAALPDVCTPADGRRRIVLRFLASPTEILGDESGVTGVVLELNEAVLDGEGVVRAQATGRTELLGAGLVLRSIGYRAVPLAGLPFDESRHVVPNHDGRVDGMPGVYVTGWIKRGPSGYIGTNKSCALETVNHLLRDANTEQLPTPTADRRAFTALAASRRDGVIDLDGWRRIDDLEKLRGLSAGRPRVKVVDVEEMRRVARETPAEQRPRRRWRGAPSGR